MRVVADLTYWNCFAFALVILLIVCVGRHPGKGEAGGSSPPRSSPDTWVKVEAPRIIIHKTNQPDIVVHFFHTHGLASENLAEIYFFVARTNASAIGDHNDFVVKRMIDMRQSFIDPRSWPIDLGRTLHP